MFISTSLNEIVANNQHDLEKMRRVNVRSYGDQWKLMEGIVVLTHSSPWIGKLLECCINYDISTRVTMSKGIVNMKDSQSQIQQNTFRNYELLCYANSSLLVKRIFVFVMVMILPLLTKFVLFWLISRFWTVIISSINRSFVFYYWFSCICEFLMERKS